MNALKNHFWLRPLIFSLAGLLLNLLILKSQDSFNWDSRYVFEQFTKNLPPPTGWAGFTQLFGRCSTALQT